MIMRYLHAIAGGHHEWATYAAPLIALQRSGFGRRGFGGRRGSFGVLRLLFVLLFTTVLGPIGLVALLVFVAYRFYASRRSR
jgi:hypothetical protein